MTRRIRIVVGALLFLIINLVFLDFTGWFAEHFHWVLHLQLFPAIITFHVVVLVAWLAVTLLAGRLYCSTICPLGVYQDLVSGISSRLHKKPCRFKYCAPTNGLRYTFLIVFALAIFFGISTVTILLEPYSTYGAACFNFLAPAYRWINNLLADLATQTNTYSFYHKDITIVSTLSMTVFGVYMLAVTLLAWFSGRFYCNTICPVGTALGIVSHFAWLRPRIVTQKCRQCCKCERICKAGCIDYRKQIIDSSRCVACFDCVDACQFGAITLLPSSADEASLCAIAGNQPLLSGLPKEQVAAQTPNSPSIASAPTSAKPHTEPESSHNEADCVANEAKTMSAANECECERPHVDNSPDQNAVGRRNILTGVFALLAAGTAASWQNQAEAKPQNKALPSPDHGSRRKHERSERLPRQTSLRQTNILPPGAQNKFHFARHCTACLLCVSVCPNQVIKLNSNQTISLPQPTIAFDNGWCRPECVKCSQVCPTSAINPITTAEKTSVQIGHAVWNSQACLITTEGVTCKACSRACPNNAISMASIGSREGKQLQVPVVDTERCLGCGACEYYCPARPLAAIHVEGHSNQRRV